MNALPRWHGLAALALLAAGPVSAEVGFALALQPRVARYDAVEKTPGGFVLNRDRGELHGGGARIDLRVGGPARGLEVGLDATALRGSPRYTGFTQFGLPLETGTRQRWQRLALSVAPAVDAGRAGWQLQPALVLAELRSERAILASSISSAATETLRLQSAGLALAASHRAGDHSWRLGAAADWSFRRRLAVETFGQLDPFSLEPDSARRRSLALAHTSVLAGGWQLELAWRRGLQVAGASPSRLVTRGGVPAAVATYPGSRQWVTELGLGLVHVRP